MGQSRQLSDRGQVCRTAAVGQKAVMADAHKAFRQAVEQEAANELDGCYRERFGAALLAFFIGEGHHFDIERFDAAVGQTDAQEGAPVAYADVKEKKIV